MPRTFCPLLLPPPRATLFPYTTLFRSNIDGTHYVLAALRELQPRCRFYFAGSSEMFGRVRETPQRETTPFHPRRNGVVRSEEHTSELQSLTNLVCRLLLEKKKAQA